MAGRHARASDGARRAARGGVGVKRRRTRRVGRALSRGRGRHPAGVLHECRGRRDAHSARGVAQWAGLAANDLYRLSCDRSCSNIWSMQASKMCATWSFFTRGLAALGPSRGSAWRRLRRCPTAPPRCLTSQCNSAAGLFTPVRLAPYAKTVAAFFLARKTRVADPSPPHTHTHTHTHTHWTDRAQTTKISASFLAPCTR